MWQCTSCANHRVYIERQDALRPLSLGIPHVPQMTGRQMRCDDWIGVQCKGDLTEIALCVDASIIKSYRRGSDQSCFFTFIAVCGFITIINSGSINQGTVQSTASMHCLRIIAMCYCDCPTAYSRERLAMSYTLVLSMHKTSRTRISTMQIHTRSREINCTAV